MIRIPSPKGPEIIRGIVCEIYWKEGNTVCENCQAAELGGAGGVRNVSTSRNMSSYFLFFSFFKHISLLSGLDSAADFKLGYFPHQLLTPKSASFCPNDEGEDQYENSDEEEEDGNEKPGEGL